MATNILDIANNFDDVAVGYTDSGVGNHTAGVVVALKPSSADSAVINSIHFAISISNTYSTTGAAEEHKIDNAQVYVVEGAISNDDLKSVAQLFAANSQVTKATLQAVNSNLKLRYTYNINNYNMVPLTQLNIKGAQGKTLFVILNCPNSIGNTSGSAVTYNLTLTAFGQFVNAEELKKIQFIR